MPGFVKLPKYQFKPASHRKSKVLVARRSESGYVNHAEVRKQVLERDGYQCRHTVDGVVCGARATDVHHIVPVERGGRSIGRNMISLCHKCHSLMPGHEHMR